MRSRGVSLEVGDGGTVDGSGCWRRVDGSQAGGVLRQEWRKIEVNQISPEDSIRVYRSGVLTSYERKRP
ncbi:hypothetical protein KFK09_004394 [Dendrobium nobile]|uniref:Uncharacterized protein n=1 Tax=Dendrobium nobile TaxID=94219 RepID=A0A8T3C2R7_DENNO|nr:hypothetical protein KFK09_004394 [Dendrobium nobile]